MTLIILTIILAFIIYIEPDFFSAFHRISNIVHFLSGNIDIASADASLRARLSRSWTAVQVWTNHPFIGVGLDNLLYHTPSYTQPTWHPHGPREAFVYSSNIWTQALATTGIIGFLALVSLLVGSLIIVHKSMGPKIDGQYTLLLLLCSLLVWSNIVASFTVFVNPIRWLDLSFVYLILANKHNLSC